MTTITQQAFRDTESLVSIDFGTSSPVVGAAAFRDATALRTISFGTGSPTIGAAAFMDDTALTALTIPDTITSIGAGAFRGCSGIVTLSIGSGITTIGASVFMGTSRLASVTISNSVTSIGDSAFADTSSLAAITIPSSVTTIGANAFQSATSLRSVTFNGNAPTSVGSNAFGGVTATAYITRSATGFGNAGTWEGLTLSYSTPPTDPPAPDPTTPTTAEPASAAAGALTTTQPLHSARSRTTPTAIVTTFTADGPGIVTQSVIATASRQRTRAGGGAICTVTATITQAGTVRLVCPLSNSIKRLRLSRSVGVIVTTTFTHDQGLVQTASSSLQLARSQTPKPSRPSGPSAVTG